MLTWTEQLEIYEREYKKLSAKPLTLPLASFLRALGPIDHLDEAAEACRVFAHTRLWPDLSEEARLEVCLSLASAVRFCEAGLLMGSPEDESQGSTPEQINKVLIDYWRGDGRSHWLWLRHVLTPDQREEQGEPS